MVSPISLHKIQALEETIYRQKYIIAIGCRVKLLQTKVFGRRITRTDEVPFTSDGVYSMHNHRYCTYSCLLVAKL